MAISSSYSGNRGFFSNMLGGILREQKQGPELEALIRKHTDSWDKKEDEWRAERTRLVDANFKISILPRDASAYEHDKLQQEAREAHKKANKVFGEFKEIDNYIRHHLFHFGEKKPIQTDS